jgi:excisionase family DNA binding protein
MGADYMTTREAADHLKVSKSRVDQFCRLGRLPFRMLGTARMLKRADVEAFAKLKRKDGYPKGRSRERPAGR